MKLLTLRNKDSEHVKYRLLYFSKVWNVCVITNGEEISMLKIYLGSPKQTQ